MATKDEFKAILIDTEKCEELFAFDPKYQSLARKHSNIKAIIIRGTNVVGAALGYLGAGAPDAVFDGVATPIKVYAISSHADDTDLATKDARKVRLIGFTTTDIVEEIFSMSGVTEVPSDNLLQRIFSPHISQHGSGGGDAAGDITITSKGQVATYVTIAAGANGGNGCIFYLPENFHLFIHKVAPKITSTEDTAKNATGAEINFSLGNITQYPDGSIDVGRDDPILSPKFPVIHTKPNVEYINPFTLPFHGSSGGQIILTTTELVSGEDVDLEYELVFWVWHDEV